MVATLLEWQPMACDIRSEGDCPNCGQWGLLSYQTPDFPPKERSGNEETCGYYCELCGWGNAGSRPVTLEVFDADGLSIGIEGSIGSVGDVGMKAWDEVGDLSN